MGNRYRAYCLTINGRNFNYISMSCDPSESDLQSLKESALSQTAHLSDNLNSTIPYFLGFVRTSAGNGHNTRITIRHSSLPKLPLKPPGFEVCIAINDGSLCE